MDYRAQAEQEIQSGSQAQAVLERHSAKCGSICMDAAWALRALELERDALRAVLARLVEGEQAGLIRNPVGLWVCLKCDGYAAHAVEYKHAADCPITQGRALLEVSRG